MVAVFYQEDYFIGEVTSIRSEDEAEVNFMEKTKAVARGKGCVFRWPHPADCCSISAEVVFAKNLTLAPSSSSGRSFVVETPGNLQGRYEAFQLFLTENLL